MRSSGSLWKKWDTASTYELLSCWPSYTNNSLPRWKQHTGTVSEWFHAKKEVRRGCVLFSYLFNILAEVVMRLHLDSKVKYKLDDDCSRIIGMLVTSSRIARYVGGGITTAGGSFRSDESELHPVISTDMTKVVASDGYPATHLFIMNCRSRLMSFHSLGRSLRKSEGARRNSALD